MIFGGRFCLTCTVQQSCSTQILIMLNIVTPLAENNLLLFVTEPLTLIKSRSSPPVVKTYKKFDTRLICAFKGGHSPVNITLTRRGRKLTDGVVVKGKILYGTVKTNHWAAFGLYKCLATDAKGNQVKYRINLKKAGKTLFRERVISSPLGLMIRIKINNPR